tara:strand:- start:18 stop:344 length:327 start_codon:yes stop_codon:yes gene_type:complete
MENIEIKFQYTKPYFLLAELLMLFSFKEMSVRRIMADVNKLGRGLDTIGFFKLPGIKGYCIEPYAFQKELERIAVVQPKYDYDLTHQNEIKAGLKVVANNQTIKRSTN